MGTSVVPLPNTPHVLQTIPEPVGLPEAVAQAFTTAMAEVVNLIQSPQVAKRFATVALTQLRTNLDLQACTPISLIAVFVEAAEAGLDLSGQNECFVIPYKNRDKAGRVTSVEATLQLGYAGLMKLAMSHPDVLDIYADKVCVNDHWVYCGMNHLPEHTFPGRFAPRGPVEGFYSIAELAGGRYRCLQMSVLDMKAHAKKYSRNAENKVWSEGPGGGFEGMALKTMLRKMCNPKMIPMSARVADILYKMDVVEGVVIPEPDEQESPETIASRQREAGKSIEEHVGDLYGDKGDPTGFVPPTTAEAEAIRHEAILQRDREAEVLRTLHLQMTELLDAQGVNEARRKAWRQRTAKKYHLEHFDQMSEEQLRAVYTDLLVAAEQKALEAVSTEPDPVPGASPAPEPAAVNEAVADGQAILDATDDDWPEPEHDATCVHEEPELPMVIPPQGWREELRHLASNTLEVVEGSRDKAFAEESIKVCEAILRLCDNPEFVEKEASEQFTRLRQIGVHVSEELGF